MFARQLAGAISHARLSNQGGSSGKAPPSQNAPAGSVRARAGIPKRREKMFGEGRALPLDRNAKARVAAYARALSHRTEKGKHYGELTDKFLTVLRVLLWDFHNAGNGRCFPS